MQTAHREAPAGQVISPHTAALPHCALFIYNSVLFLLQNATKKIVEANRHSGLRLVASCGLYLGIGAGSRCCRSQWSNSSFWRHFWSCSRRPGLSSQRGTGRTSLPPPSHRSASQSSSKHRLLLSHRCCWHTAGTHTSNLKDIEIWWFLSSDTLQLTAVTVLHLSVSDWGGLGGRTIYWLAWTVVFNSLVAGCSCYTMTSMLLMDGGGGTRLMPLSLTPT